MIIGFLASIGICIAYMPQCIKLYKTKDASGLSLPTFILIWISMILFTIHGINILDLPLILSSVTSLIQNSYILYIIIKSKICSS